MVFRLTNQNNPCETLNLTWESWYGILDLAEQYGWNPMGTVIPGMWQDLEMSLNGYFLVDSNGCSNGGHPETETTVSRMVVLEDALNLAEALDQAFLDYEPLKVPASFYLFEPSGLFVSRRPSIGAIAALHEFCRLGAFWIEPYNRHPNGSASLAGDSGWVASGIQRP